MHSFNLGRPIVTLLVAVVMTVPVAACSDDDHGHSEESLVTECQAIMNACHDTDPSDAEAAMCHATAHQNDRDQCIAASNCIELCHGAHGADGGHEADGGTPSADSGAAGDSGP